MIDMNHGSEAVYGGAAVTGRINALIDDALVDRNRAQTPRTYLGGSRIGELPPRIAASPDFYLCRWCAYAQRCWEGAV